MTIVEILLKASVLIGLAALAHALLARRTSAAARHMVWTLAIAGLLLLPMLAAALPGWTALELSAPQERLMHAIADSVDNASKERRRAVPGDRKERRRASRPDCGAGHSGGAAGSCRRGDGFLPDAGGAARTAAGS